MLEKAKWRNTCLLDFTMSHIIKLLLEKIKDLLKFPVENNTKNTVKWYRLKNNWNFSYKSNFKQFSRILWLMQLLSFPMFLAFPLIHSYKVTWAKLAKGKMSLRYYLSSSLVKKSLKMKHEGKSEVYNSLLLGTGELITGPNQTYSFQCLQNYLFIPVFLFK